jgi:plastocyanin
MRTTPPNPTRRPVGIARLGVAALATAALSMGVGACGDDNGSEGDATPDRPTRTIVFDAVDFDYEDLDLDGIAVGDTIRFEMTNSGGQHHEFEVLDGDGNALGEVEAIDPGQTGAANITFDEAGTHTYQCILVDEATGDRHTMLGMEGEFEVAASR